MSADTRATTNDAWPRPSEMGNGMLRLGFTNIDRAHAAAIAEDTGTLLATEFGKPNYEEIRRSVTRLAYTRVADAFDAATAENTRRTA